MGDEAKMSFFDHLEELRSRLIRAFIAIGFGFIGCLYFSETIFFFLMKPILSVLPATAKALHFTNLTEPFMINLKVAALAGFFIASPYVFYEIWLFISPALYKKEKKFIVPFILFSTIFFVGGASFGYFVVFPVGFKFFLNYVNDFIKPVITMQDYFSFSVTMLIIFGVLFETPIIIVFLAAAGLVTGRQLLSVWRYVIVVASIVSAVLTPADAISMMLMDIPLLALYFLSVIFVFILFPTRKVKHENV